MKTQLIPLPNPRAVFALATAPDGRILAIGQHGTPDAQPNLVLYDWRRNLLDTVVESAPDAYVYDLTFDSQGRLYYTLGGEGITRFAPRTQERTQLQWADTREVRRLSLSPDDDLLLLSGTYTEVRSCPSGDLIWRLPGYVGEGIQDSGPSAPYERSPAPAAFAIPSTNIIVAGHQCEHVEVYCCATGRRLRRLPGGPLQAWCLVYSPELAMLAVNSSVPDAVLLWSYEDGRRLLEQVFNTDYVGVTSLAFYTPWRVLAIGTSGGYLNLHCVDTGHLLRSTAAHLGSIRRIVVYPQTGLIATAGDDGKVRVEQLGPNRS